MKGRVMVGKGELGGERVRHGKGIGEAGWGSDGRESDGGDRGDGRLKGHAWKGNRGRRMG